MRLDPPIAMLAVAETIVWAGLYYIFPALLVHWEADLGWSKTELTGAFTASIAVSALHRQESRGAHSRPDFPARDDQTWLKHSLYYKDADRMDYKPVRTKPLTVESFPPKERVY